MEMDGLKFITLLCMVVTVPLAVSISEIGRTLGSGFLIPAALSACLLGILGIFSFLAISENAEFFEVCEKGIMWITLAALIATALTVFGELL